MSERGICSRREADRYIEAGQVRVNGEIVSTLGAKFSEEVKIELLLKAQQIQKEKVTIILNKPIGFVSTQPEKGYKAAIELITKENQADKKKFSPSMLKGLSVAGRLDIDSKGLLILTQDGVLAKQLIGPDSNVEKEYLVRIEGNITEKILNQLRFGLRLEGKPLKAAKVEILKPNLLKIILTEGKKRQIRKMCELVGLQVIGLKRVRIGKILLGDLPEGKWRFLSPNSVNEGANSRGFRQA